MASLFSKSPTKKRAPVIAIDLGTRTTKAVYIQRHGTGFELLHYAVQDAPAYEKGVSPAVLAEHLKQVTQSIGVKGKRAVLMLGVNDSLLRLTEAPMAPVADIRQMLKFNSKNYLQQDLPDHVFDCFLLPPRGTNTQKCRVLVGGAKKAHVDQLTEASKLAGLSLDQASPGQIGMANAFELAEPEVFAKEVVALVEIGFKNSTINILMSGEISLSRVIAFGGDRLTSSLAEMLNINYSDAEQMKLSKPDEVQPFLPALLTSLGRELRASIDFFEKQEDKTVTQVFVSGASVRSPGIIEALQSELMVPCKSWNPIGFLKLSLSPERMASVEAAACRLAVATGGAISAF